MGSMVGDAHAPAVSQIADNYYMEILVRIGRKESPADTKGVIRGIIREFGKDKLFRHIALTVDVDPQ